MTNMFITLFLWLWFINGILCSGTVSDRLLDELLSLRTRKSAVPAPKVALTYTTGYLRANYFDASTKRSEFVQAVVLAIGVCYKYQVTAPMYRELVKVVINTGTDQATLYYANYLDMNCMGAADSTFTRQQFLTSDILTNNNVKLNIRWVYIADLNTAVSLPDYKTGSLISYFGANNLCSGYPFQYLVATQDCSNYPDFFGKIICNEPSQELRYKRFTFSADHKCQNNPDVFKTQPFVCTNEGSMADRSYEQAVCIGGSKKAPPPPKTPPPPGKKTPPAKKSV